MFFVIAFNLERFNFFSQCVKCTLFCKAADFFFSTIAMKAEEGKIFGSVTAADLAEALAAKGVELDRKTITVEAIKNVGEYEASAKLHREVKATIKFTVVAEE